MSAVALRPQLDLLLINPGGQRRIYQGLSRELAAKEPPIWAGLLATHARLRGRSVEILDQNALDLSPEEVAERVAALRPTLTVVTVYGHNPNASTFAMPGARDVCAAISSSIVTGPSPPQTKSTSSSRSVRSGSAAG